MFKINLKNLEIGDIILVDNTKRNKKSKLIGNIIKLSTQGDYTHALIYLEGTYAEANKNGVHFHNLSRLYFKNKEDVKVLRYKGLTYQQKQKISSTIREIYGTPYSINNAILSALKLNPKENKKNYKGEFCSRIIAKAYSSANINLHNNKTFENITPEDLNSTPLLKKITINFLEVSEKELESEDPSDYQEKIVTNLIKEINEIIDGIVVFSLSGLLKYLANNNVKKEIDKKIAETITKSGYLDLWKREKKINANEYDYVLIKKEYKLLNDKEKKERIISEIHLAIQTIVRHYYQNYVYFLKKDLKFELETFSLLKNLYLNLINNAIDRLENHLNVFYSNDQEILNTYFGFRKTRILKNESTNKKDQKIKELIQKLDINLNLLINEFN